MEARRERKKERKIGEEEERRRRRGGEEERGMEKSKGRTLWNKIERENREIKREITDE